MSCPESIASPPQTARPAVGPAPLYTAEQRQRRDGTVWTLVQGVLAAYAAYLINATQFVLKMRAARLGQAQADASMGLAA